ncbi:MAG TPA: sulfate adenylyltransferase [Burkholderiales bacterium]|jgi:sulfate adenylyltransferase
MSDLVRPHGSSVLRPRLLEGEERQWEARRAAGMQRVALSSRELGDLMMLGIGAFTPLEGFMTRSDWKTVCEDYRLASGLFWPIPITLSADEADAAAIAPGTEVALAAAGAGEPVATMRVVEKYAIDKAFECKTVFRTVESEHPGVRMVMNQGAVNLAGPVKVLSQGDYPWLYPNLFLSPGQTRALFQARGWSTVAAFQTRNPMHRAHEYLVKVALELCDGVLVHSLLGSLKPGDIPASVSTRAIAVLIENYFRRNTVIQAGYPLDMRYGGPREALLHAVFRQNYGCSHLIVGRDHAGVANYYGPYDAQRAFDEIPRGSLHIAPLKIDWTFWCRRCGGMASARSCPHGQEDRLLLSGTRLREALREGDAVPPEFSRPEVLQVLQHYYSEKAAVP